MIGLGGRGGRGEEGFVNLEAEVENCIMRCVERWGGGKRR